MDNKLKIKNAKCKIKRFVKFQRFNLISFISLFFFLSLLILFKLSYAATLIFSYDFTNKFLEDNKWDTKNFAKAKGIKIKLSHGYLELKGNIEGQREKNSNYIFLSKFALKSPYKYEASVKISFSGIPKKRLSEEEEYRMSASGTPKAEGRLGGGTLSSGFALRPPAAYFGIADTKEGKSLIFRIEPQEVYVMASTSGNKKARGQIFKKIKDIVETKWYTYKIIYDSKNQRAYFFIGGEPLYSVKELGIKEGFIFFGVTGEEGVGTKTINFARFDDLKLEVK